MLSSNLFGFKSSGAVAFVSILLETNVTWSSPMQDRSLVHDTIQVNFQCTSFL